MSYVLCFRKGGVDILSLGTSHPLAIAFQNKPYDEFKPMPKTAFADAMHILIRQNESFEDDAEMLVKMLEYSTDWEERWDIVTRLNDIKKERRAIEKAKIMLEMLEMIWEEGSSSDGDTNSGLEWGAL